MDALLAELRAESARLVQVIIEDEAAGSLLKDVGSVLDASVPRRRVLIVNVIEAITALTRDGYPTQSHGTVRPELLDELRAVVTK